MEKWLPVVGFPGYEVSDLGRVRSFWKKVGLVGRRGSAVVIGQIPKMMKPFVRKDGRHCVCLYIASRPTLHRVHVLVLEAFVGPRQKGQLGLHGKKGNRDNSLGNLRWGTFSENNGTDRYRDGTAIVGEKLSWTKLSSADVKDIRESAKNGESKLSIANRYKVSRRNINDIVNRRTWRWLE